MAYTGTYIPTTATQHTMHRPGTHRGTGTSVQAGDCHSVGVTRLGIIVGIHQRGIITTITIGEPITTTTDIMSQEAGNDLSAAATAMQYTPTVEALHTVVMFLEQTARHVHHRATEQVEPHASTEELRHSRDAQNARQRMSRRYITVPVAHATTVRVQEFLLSVHAATHRAQECNRTKRNV